ncbi:MAG: nuclear transport factor 2 family protein [Verrucomicrobiales bacterium]|nr:nuclear transport factor 2 family protein [Verrucomicrobiales bacterium]MCP5525454.1 nuclear transport factor 2 family protein [Verrucomicrobiales bacterium]
MKRSSLITALMCVVAIPEFSGQAQKQAVLIKELQPVQWLVGTWEAKLRNGSSARMEVTPDLGGTVCKLRYEYLDAQGRPGWSGLYNIFHEIASGTIASLRLDSTGIQSHQVLAKASPDRLVWQSYQHTPDGFQTDATEMTKVDDDTLTVQFVHRIFAGERQPDIPEFTFRRVAPISVAAIRALDEGWSQAYVDGDVAALDKMLADDYVSIDEQVVATKKQEIEAVRSGDFRLLSWESDAPAQVRLLGDTAILTWSGTVTQETGGTEATRKMRTTTVWAKRNDLWQVVSWHGCQVTAD